MTDFHAALSKMLADAHASLDRGDVYLDPTLLTAPGAEPLTEKDLREVAEQVQVRKLSAYFPVTCCQLTDSTGVNHCQHPVWTPPPIPWRRRLRWRIQSWWSGLRMRLGSWVAGVDLDEEDDL